MSNNNNNNNNNPFSQITLKEEAQVFKSFMDIFHSKFGSSSRLTEAYGRLNSKENQSEKAILRKCYVPVLTWGVGISVITFACLRKAPREVAKYWFNKLTGRRATTFGSSNVQNTNSFGSSSSPTKNDFDLFSKEPILKRSLNLAFDVFLSIWTASVTSLIVINWKKLRSYLASIPLVKGQSVLSDELCDDFIKEYQSVPKDFWKKEHDVYSSLDNIEMFVKNCQKRKQNERRLRREMGLDRKSPVSIPSPGVFLFPWDEKMEEKEEEKSYDKFGGFEKVNILPDGDSNDEGINEWNSMNDFGDEEKKENEKDSKNRKPRWGF